MQRTHVWGKAFAVVLACMLAFAMAWRGGSAWATEEVEEPIEVDVDSAAPEDDATEADPSADDGATTDAVSQDELERDEGTSENEDGTAASAPEPAQPVAEQPAQPESAPSSGVLDADRSAIDPAKLVYNGSSLLPKIAVYGKSADGDPIRLVEGRDYEVTYYNTRTKAADTTNAGVVRVTVTGIGGFSGTLTGSYEIVPASLSLFQVEES